LNRICLDTSAYSNFRRGRDSVARFLDRAREILVPAVVLGELRVGFRLGARPAHNEELLKSFLDHPSVFIAVVDEETSVLYADLWIELREAGTPIPTNDVWVAAMAIQTGSTILTYDAHFDRVRRVGVEVLDA